MTDLAFHAGASLEDSFYEKKVRTGSKSATCSQLCSGQRIESHLLERNHRESPDPSKNRLSDTMSIENDNSYK